MANYIIGTTVEDSGPALGICYFCNAPAADDDYMCDACHASEDAARGPDFAKPVYDPAADEEARDMAMGAKWIRVNWEEVQRKEQQRIKRNERLIAKHGICPTCNGTGYGYHFHGEQRGFVYCPDCKGKKYNVEASQGEK